MGSIGTVAALALGAVPVEKFRMPEGTRPCSVQSQGGVIVGEWREHSEFTESRRYWLWREGKGFVLLPEGERFEHLSGCGQYVITSVNNEVRVRKIHDIFNPITNEPATKRTKGAKGAKS